MLNSRAIRFVNKDSENKVANINEFTVEIKEVTWIIEYYITQGYRNEPPHDKTNKMAVPPAKTQISLGIRPVWSESLLSAWRNLGPLTTQWAHSEDSDHTGRMPRLIWVFAGRTLTLLVLSCQISIRTWERCSTSCSPVNNHRIVHYCAVTCITNKE